MVQYLRREDIDDALWDDCVAHALNGLPYAYSWYLDMVADQWNALVMDNYKMVFPLPFRRKWGIRYLYQPYFSQQLGIFSREGIIKEDVIKMLDGLPKDFAFVDTNLNYANYCEHPEFQLHPRVNLELLLDKPYHETRKGYSENIRRHLQKAQKEGLKLDRGMEPGKTIDLFRSETGTGIKGLEGNDYDRLVQLLETLISNGMGATYSAVNTRGEMVASAFFIHSHNRLINLLNAANEPGKASGATAFIFDTFVNEYQLSGKVFDFEGSMIPGIARFYRGFGAVEKPYWKLKRNEMPWYIRIFRR